MRRLQRHIDGLKKLVDEGFSINHFDITVQVKRGDEIIEFAIKPKDRWTQGAGVVAANRNRYHDGKDPHEAYHKHAKAQQKARKQGEKHKESADDLMKVLDGLAKLAQKDIDEWHSWYSQGTKETNKSGHTVWIVLVDKNSWYQNLRVSYNPVSNKFKFHSQATGTITKSDKSWVTPMTFLEKLGSKAEFAKLIADPSIVEGQRETDVS